MNVKYVLEIFTDKGMIIIIDTITKPVVGTATCYGGRVSMGTKFLLSLQTGHEAYPASCTSVAVLLWG
jgi:catabolite regulation protein CreA